MSAAAAIAAAVGQLHGRSCGFQMRRPHMPGVHRVLVQPLAISSREALQAEAMARCHMSGRQTSRGGMDCKACRLPTRAALPQRTPAWTHLHDGQHQEQHGGSSQHPFVAHNLEGRDGQVSHEEVLESDLCRLHALAAGRGRQAGAGRSKGGQAGGRRMHERHGGCARWRPEQTTQSAPPPLSALHPA